MSEPPAEPAPESPPSGRVTIHNSLLDGLDVGALLDAALDEVAPLPAGMDWTPPQVEEVSELLPDYGVLELLGRGGMGAVYKCRDRKLDRLVAVKLLPPELGERSDFEERFNREAWALAQLDHPNIVRIYGKGETNAGHLYFVMEYVEGTDLAKLLRSNRKRRAAGESVNLNFLQTLQIIQQLCGALQFAHEAGIVHRDIKPANVLISTKGVVKLADFGLARPMETEANKEQMTLTGQIFGTLDYMAPEQRDGASGDHRVDIYALGVLLYEMLTGELPRGSFEPPSHRVPVDAGVDKVVAKAMRASPDERYHEVRQMTGDLSSLRDKPVPRKKFPVRKAAGWAAALTALGGAAALPWRMPDPLPNSVPPPPRSSEPPPVQRQNFLEQPFHSIPGLPQVMFCAWETRRIDFGKFVADTGHPCSKARPEHRETDAAAPLMQWNSVYYPQEPNHPVVCVGWEDAVAFCEWLTRKAEAAGEIQRGQEYRLPTDREWSLAVRLGREDGDYPWERRENRDWYAPGTTRLVPGAENIGRGFSVKDEDGIPFTAPVGSFSGKINGLSDLGGNVREWTGDAAFYNERRHVARSCSFRGTGDVRKLSRRSKCQFADVGNETLGFRVVLDLKSVPGMALQLRMRDAVRKCWGEDPKPGTGPHVLVCEETVRLDLSRAAGKTDLSPFSGLPVTEFLSSAVPGTAPLDLEPLRGMPLRRVVLSGPVKSLEPLAGMPLQYLLLEGSGGAPPSLAPVGRGKLKGLAWREFNAPPDVPLGEFPALEELDLSYCTFTDFGFLRDIPLRSLLLEGHAILKPEQLLVLTKVGELPFQRSHFFGALKLAGEQSPEAGERWLEPFKKPPAKLPWLQDWLAGGSALGGDSKRAAGASYALVSAEGKSLLRWVRDGRVVPPPYSAKVLNSWMLPVTWPMGRPDAEAFAASLGGHLATITSLDEWKALCDAYEPHLWAKGQGGFMLGAFRLDHSAPWQWLTGETWFAELPFQDAGDLYDSNIVMNGSPKGCFCRQPAHAAGFVVEFDPPGTRLPLHDVEEKMLGKWLWPDGTVLELGRFATVGAAHFEEAHWSVCDAARRTARLFLSFGRINGLLALGTDADTLVFSPLSGSPRTLRKAP